MKLVRGALGSAGDGALDIAVTHALLRRASEGRSGAVLRVYRPATPMAAFSRRDTLQPGFDRAVRAARDAGFTPVIRPSGGRAVAYTEQALVVEHVCPHDEFPFGMEERFADYGELWASILRASGADARVGAVPGEYCPGAFSVNARGQVKLVGTAQRLVRRAWLFSAVAIGGGTGVLGPLLTEIYRNLDLPFDAASVGAIGKEAPRLSMDDLEAGVIAAYDDRYGLTEATVDPAVLDSAHDLASDHRVP